MNRNDYLALAIVAALILAFWIGLIIYFEVAIR